MSAVMDDARPASVALQDVAGLLMRRWTEGALGHAAAHDAAVLEHINVLDRMALEVAEIEGVPAGGPIYRRVEDAPPADTQVIVRHGGRQAAPDKATSGAVALLLARVTGWMRAAR